MRPVLKELKKALNPEGGELCRFLINRKNNAQRTSVRKDYREAFETARVAYSIINQMDACLDSVIINNTDEIALLDTLNIGAAIQPDDFKRVAIAVAQFAFNKTIKARCLDKAGNRLQFDIIIDYSNLPFTADIFSIERAIDRVAQFASTHNFSHITVLAGDRKHHDVRVLEWSVCRAALEKIYFDVSSTSKARAEALEMAADEGHNDLRADLIAFSVEPWQEQKGE